MAARRRCVAGALDALRHGAPFLPPRLRLVEPRVQALHHLVDLAERDRAPRRHALGDQRRIRPLEVGREAVDPVARIEIAVGRDRRHGVHGRLAFAVAFVVPHTVCSAVTIGSVLLFGIVSPIASACKRMPNGPHRSEKATRCRLTAPAAAPAA